MKLPEFILKLEQTWDLRLLTSKHCDEIESFIELFDDFFQLCEGEKGSATEILTACPASKNAHKDKFVLGIYHNLRLIGLLDIIQDYPSKNTWTIGYFLIHPKYQCQGIGSKLIKDLEKALSPVKLRCIVQKQNIRGLDFWKSNGFVITAQSKDKFGKLDSLAYVLEN